MSGVVLALLASLAWGTSDFLAGVESRRTTFWAAVLISQPAALVGAGIVLAVHGEGPPSLTYLWPAMLGGILSAVAAFAQYRALALVPMSLVSPIFAASAIVPVMWGVACGERPGAMQAVGVALTLAGIVLISRDGSKQEEVPAALDERAGARSARDCSVPAGMSREHARRTGILLALIAGLGFGLLLVSFDYGGEADPYWTVSAARITAVLVVLATIGAKRPRLDLRPSAVPVLILAGLLLVGANVLFTAASTRGYLSVVAVLGWLSPAVTVIYARVFLRERLRPLQWVAAVMVFGGVICLALG